MQSLLQVLAVNEPRTGEKDGRTWQSQDVEAITRGEDGSFGKAGRLRLPKELVGAVTPGLFMGSFSLERDESREGGGRLIAKLVGLQPYALKGEPASKSATPAGVKA